MSPSKRVGNLVCFAHFDLDTCFVEQPWHFFDISTSKSGQSENGVFCTIRILTCKRASRIFAPQRRALFRHLAPHLDFREITFHPPEPQNIVRTQCFATFLPFRLPGSSFFWLLPFPYLLFSSLLFSSFTREFRLSAGTQRSTLMRYF